MPVASSRFIFACSAGDVEDVVSEQGRRPGSRGSWWRRTRAVSADQRRARPGLAPADVAVADRSSCTSTMRLPSSSVREGPRGRVSTAFSRQADGEHLDRFDLHRGALSGSSGTPGWPRPCGRCAGARAGRRARGRLGTCSVQRPRSDEAASGTRRCHCQASLRKRSGEGVVRAARSSPRRDDAAAAPPARCRASVEVASPRRRRSRARRSGSGSRDRRSGARCRRRIDRSPSPRRSKRWRRSFVERHRSAGRERRAGCAALDRQLHRPVA